MIAQAGGSRRAAASPPEHADTIVAHPKGIEAMKQYRDDVARQAWRPFGRDPDSCKVLFLISPILAETDRGGQSARRRARQRGEEPGQRLAQLGWITNIDFSKFDLDAPVGELTPTVTSRAWRSSWQGRASGRCARRCRLQHRGASVDLVGTPDQVAAQMGEVMEEVGGDGFMFSMPNVNRRTMAEITDGLVPALQRRGLTRSAYAHQHLRDNLLEF